MFTRLVYQTIEAFLSSGEFIIQKATRFKPSETLYSMKTERNERDDLGFQLEFQAGAAGRPSERPGSGIDSLQWT